MQKDFSEDIGHSPDFENKISGMERTLTNRRENEKKNDNLVIGHIKESGFRIFRGISAFARGIFQKKAARSSVHFTADFSKKNSYFAQVTRPISSVSAEQYRVLVKI